MTQPQWAQDALETEAAITEADFNIEDLKGKLKDAKENRENLVQELREAVKRQKEPMLVDQPK